MAKEQHVPLDLVQLTATPAAPAAGRVRVYAKNDGKAYRRAPDGTETELGAPAEKLFVQQTQPTFSGPGLWIEVDADGYPITFWVNT